MTRVIVLSVVPVRNRLDKFQLEQPHLRKMGLRTGKDNDDGDSDADGIIDVAHNGADERTST